MLIPYFKQINNFTNNQKIVSITNSILTRQKFKTIKRNGTKITDKHNKNNQKPNQIPGAVTKSNKTAGSQSYRPTVNNKHRAK